MKKKAPRRRIDVNVEELDRIIDGAKSAPMSESDSEKLKTALHALAERLLPRSKTEKTNSVFSQESGTPEDKRKQKKARGRPRAQRRGCVSRGGESEGGTFEAGTRRSLPGLRPRQRLHAEGAESAGADRGTGLAGGHRI